MDRISKATRSRIMSRIKSEDTKPEVIVRRKLHSLGIRYRLHDQTLPGKPDVLIKKYKLVIQIKGCFWHGHSGCKDGHSPKSNKSYWIEKLKKNKNRDLKNRIAYKNLNYKLFEIWECETKDERNLNLFINNVLGYIETRTC